MNNKDFTELKTNLLNYYNDVYCYNDDGISSNNVVLQNALENFNDLLQYYNVINDHQILNDFNDQYGDQQLKDSSIKKLIQWLDDIDLIFEFEHDLIINKACDWYVSKESFLYYADEESCEDLDHWLNGKKLTEQQKDIIESELSSYIDDEQKYLYIHKIAFEFTLPKMAILRAYKEYKKANK